MKELQDIIAAFNKVKTTTIKVALATLVKVSGSTYRCPGARMLMTPDGLSIGAISGGCLESDVFEKAQTVIESGIPLVVKYDTTSEEDLIWGLGLGCEGIAYILIEALQGKESKEIALIKKCFNSRTYGAIATVINVEGETHTKLAQRLLLSSDSIINNLNNEELTAEVLRDAQIAIAEKKSCVKEYQLKTAKIEVFIEIIQPPLSLIIFGAGYDVLPLIRFAKELGWYVTVVDNRQREASKKRFQQADRIHLSSPQDILQHIELTERSVAVVMSHNYLDDLEMLKSLLPSSLKYLGILGPKKRTNRLLQELQEERINPTSDIYSPVGLDIGADNAEEIALSIIAEIQTVIAQRQGGFLRDRTQPIHFRG